MGLTVQSLALTSFTLLAIGYVLFAILSQKRELAPTIRDVLPILHTETLIVGAAVGSFWIGGWVLYIALLVHATRVMFEATHVVNLRVFLANPLIVGTGFAVLCILGALIPLTFLAILAVTALIACVTHQVLGLGADNRTLTALIDLLMFPTVPLFIFTIAGLQGGFGVWLLVAFILVETFDGYALLGGKLFGKTKAFPVLSPNKTIEGLGIGAAMLMVTAAVLGGFLSGLPIWQCAGVALVSGALTIAGDLTASRLKRLSKVKDYPPILPHQGGLFDITDAWIATGAGLVCLAILFG